MRSLPARSTSTKEPFLTSLVAWFTPSSRRVTIRCDRLELSFMLVKAVFLLALASLKCVQTEYIENTSISLILSMVVVPLPMRSMMVSRQISWMDRKAEYFHLKVSLMAISAKMNSMLLEVRPRWLYSVVDSLYIGYGPIKVQVLPEPVCPYAKIQTFLPSTELWTNCEISMNTLSWLSFSEKMCSKTQVCSKVSFPSSITCFLESYSFRVLSEVTETMELFVWLGLTRQQTRMFPFCSWSSLFSFFLRLNISCCMAAILRLELSILLISAMRYSILSLSCRSLSQLESSSDWSRQASSNFCVRSILAMEIMLSSSSNLWVIWLKILRSASSFFSNFRITFSGFSLKRLSISLSACAFNSFSCSISIRAITLDAQTSEISCFRFLSIWLTMSNQRLMSSQAPSSCMRNSFLQFNRYYGVRMGLEPSSNLFMQNLVYYTAVKSVGMGIIPLGPSFA